MTDWREPLFTADEMRAVEARYAGPTLELMERAGRACAEAAVARFPQARRWGVHCGGGANGGDGLVAARHLRRLGRDVELVLRVGSDSLRGDTAENFRRCRELDIQPVEAPTATNGIVDALLGTGFSGALRPEAGAAIDAINGSDVPVVSVDVPSGVDASSGEIGTRAVQADLTVSFHGRKVGHLVAPGAFFAGEVVVVDIGLKRGDAANDETATGQVGEAIVAELPVRQRSDNKYSAGAVVVVGGSEGMTGAPALAGLAALRTGAGLVFLCVPRSLNPVFEGQTLEVMTRPCVDEGGTLTDQALPTIVDAAGRASAVAIGPGLGRTEGSRRLVHGLLAGVSLPVLIDADGLWALSGDLESLASRAAPTVLTPHAGELGRLLERPSSWVDSHRLAAAKEAAERAAAVVVLKGSDTIVSTPDGEVLISDLGTPGLATAGSGDVLTGIVAAALAKRLSVASAAAVGVALAGLAARAAGHRVGMPGLVASDVIQEIPAVVAAAHDLPGPLRAAEVHAATAQQAR